MRWKDVAEKAGLTTEGLRGVRNGTGEIRSLTKSGIERALNWAPGSVDAILAGGEPTLREQRITIAEAEADTRHAGQNVRDAETAEDDPKMRRAMELMAEAQALLAEIRRERREGA